MQTAREYVAPDSGNGLVGLSNPVEGFLRERRKSVHGRGHSRTPFVASDGISCTVSVGLILIIPIHLGMIQKLHQAQSQSDYAPFRPDWRQAPECVEFACHT